MSEDVEVVPSGGSFKAHAILGASSSDRWMNCVGSVALSEGQPNNSSRYAMEGTAAHHLAEICLELDTHPSAFIGQFMSYKGDLLEDMPDEVDETSNPVFEIEEDDMAKAVAVYVEAIWETKKELEAEYPGQVQVFLERSFNLSKLYPDMFGTNDYCLFVPGVILIVFDYKHGRGKTVEIEWNPQLLYYGLGAILEICKTTADFPKTVRCVVVQPRKAHKNGSVRGFDYTLDQVKDFSKTLVEAAAKTEAVPRNLKGDQWLEYLKPGSWCTFCRAKARPCPALFNQAQELALSSFDDLTEDEMLNYGETGKELATRTFSNRDMLMRALAMAPIIDAWLRDLSARAQHELENGRPIDGFKLVRKRSNRRIEDEKKAIAVLRQKGIPDEDMFRPRKLKTPAQLEKVKSIGKDVVATISWKPEGTLTMVERSDIREEVIVNPFSDLSAEELGIIDADFTVVDEGADFDFLLPAPEDATDWDIL